MSTLVQRITDLATRVATECKSVRTLLNGNAADNSALATTAKSNLVAAINELKGITDSLAGSGAIADGTTATTSTWSSSKIASAMSAAIAALVGGAPTTLDTLNELATALADDANFVSTITASLGNRVRVDVAQGLTAPQQAQALSNIGAQDAASIGTPDTNFVTTFTSGLV